MKKNVKRILSFVLMAVMVFALLPVFGKPMVVKADDVPQEHCQHDEKDNGVNSKYHVGWDKISTWAELEKLGKEGGSGYLFDNIEISETFSIESGKNVNLCLNGYSITQTADYSTTIKVNGTLNLYDKKGDSGKITHANGKNGSGVKIENDGTFTMNGGTISGNNAGFGGGVCNNGTFTMNGGTISGNNASYGGGVDNYGIFTMKGGTISGNNATNDGGGVEYFKGTFTMNGGTISGNNAKSGGGVYSYHPFVKEGGDIDGSIESEAGTLFTVTFNSNGKPNNTIITQYVLPNKETNLAPNKFSYGNYKFGCWNTMAGGSGDPYQDEAELKNINSNLVLYACWIESYDVTFKVNNGSWFDKTNDDRVVTILRYVGENKELKLNASDIPSINPVNGYKGSWDAEPDTVNNLSENKEYTYTFAPIEYTIKYDANGGTGTMNNQSRTYNVNASLTANAFTFEGRTFDGWNTAADGSGTPFSNGEVTGNLSETDQETITLYAQWTTNTFTISWKNYDGTVLETDKDVAYGSTPTYDGETPVRAKEGNKVYTFSGWTPEIDTVKGAATYTATYSEEVVEQTEPETPQNPTEPETPEEPEEEIPEKDWLDDLRLPLNIAAELGGPQTVEYSGDFALSYDIMEYLKEHTDITLVYNVTYEGVTYTVTIPAGKAIADANIGWYGPLWLLANYGGDNVPEIIAGSGKYTVVAGDTLSAIAEKFGTTVDYLAQKNGIKNPDYIIVGQVIVY